MFVKLASRQLRHDHVRQQDINGAAVLGTDANGVFYIQRFQDTMTQLIQETAGEQANGRIVFDDQNMERPAGMSV